MYRLSFKKAETTLVKTNGQPVAFMFKKLIRSTGNEKLQLRINDEIERIVIDVDSGSDESDKSTDTASKVCLRYVCVCMWGGGGGSQLTLLMNRNCIRHYENMPI